MSKIKLTKGALKRQRDSLKQYQHYLPTLQLKKQQLQLKIEELRTLLQKKESVLHDKERSIEPWVGLLADPQLNLLNKDSRSAQRVRRKPLSKNSVAGRSSNKGQESQSLNFRDFICPKEVLIEISNIAGAKIYLLKRIFFNEVDYDFYLTPFWIDRGIKELQHYFSLFIEVDIVKQQLARLQEELRVTTQRVNLFEKIKIPECVDNIRIIRIYLGDQQANAVGISKVAKKKIEARTLEEVMV